MKINRRSFLVLAFGALSGGLQEILPAHSASKSDIIVEDAFGNVINDKGIALVDWDGYIANPAVPFFLRPPADLTLPATVILSSAEPLLYFDLPSDVGPNGPSKKVELQKPSDRVPVYLSVFPDRGTADRDYTLNLDVIDINGGRRTSAINVHVFDQDTDNPSPFKITADFSHDQTGFFQNAAACEVVRQASKDWAYFIDDMHLDPVPAGAENTWIYDPNSMTSGAVIPNVSSYTGFLLCAFGRDIPEHRSEGYAPLQGGFQSSRGTSLPIRRSGGIGIETLGNYNVLGWSLTTKDGDWWKAGNLSDEVNELFSIVHHEMGHALGFITEYPQFASSEAAGFLSSPDLLEYHGRPLKIDNSGHFDGEIDDASGFGAFGNEYHGAMPQKRWIITKLDVLSAEAVGYKVRKTFDLAILIDSLPQAQIGKPYTATLKARGGIPWYKWALENGDLPPGLSLDASTGTISGMPQHAGTFHFSVSVTDSSEKRTTVSVPLTLAIGQTPSPTSKKAWPKKQVH